VDVVDEFGRQHNRLLPAGGVETLKTAPEPKRLFHSVSVVQFVKQRADDVIQARAQPAAGDNPCPGSRGIKE
jgi:hypothetical protein